MARTRALFESWRGRYNDSPRVISETLSAVAPKIEQAWVSSPRGVFPEGTELIPRHSPQYFLALARCDLLVTNDLVTRQYFKGPKVVYVQTWHGSPIKVIGLHESAPRYRNGKRHLGRLLRDVAKWDYLLSPSKAYSEIFRGAFGYEGEILEVGYPRNDILVADDGTRRAAVRDSLSIGPDQLVVLYAPTWRDDAQLPTGGFYQPELIEWDQLFRHLPEGAVVLNRLHQHVASSTLPQTAGRLIDVSQHEEIADLILASDALVSDYSSLIYDYAVYGKPIILHTPDLAHYRDSVRAFYFDYASWAPGPITSTTAELGEALGALGEVERAHADAYQLFVTKYCEFEKGQASRSVVDLLVSRHFS